MTRTRCVLALLLTSIAAADAPAQFFAPPIIGLPIILRDGVAFRYNGGRLQVRGFIPAGDAYGAILPVAPTPFGYQQVAPAFLPYGYYGYRYGPYGAVDQRITVTVITPTVAVRPRLSLAQGPERYDVSGIDLDVESSAKIWGNKPDAARKGEVVKAPAEKNKGEVAANIPVPPPPLPRPPKLQPDGDRLIAQGIAAFREGEYGLALFRFRQADEAVPPAARALLYQGQALIAVGKYREAADTLRKAFDRLPNNFPASAFSPRKELYENRNELWAEHHKQLETALSSQPKNADFLFLLGYLAWFEGERGIAIDYFRQSRELAADNVWCDWFLRAAKN